MDGGKVSTVTYPSQDPIAKTLRSFQVDITNNPPLADLLNQLRGAGVTVSVLNETRRGVVLGAEKRPTVTMQGSPPVDIACWPTVEPTQARRFSISTFTCWAGKPSGGNFARDEG